MVKRIAIAVLSLIFVVSVAAVSFSAEKEKMMTHMGKISAIDAKAKTVTIKDAKGTESVMTEVDEKTLSTLKVGDEVECMHEMKAGKAVCKGMKKVTPGKKPKTSGY
jgi:ABC-type enterochelin transport system substrate-binding protein